MVSSTAPESRKSPPYRRVSRSRTRMPESFDVRPTSRIPFWNKPSRSDSIAGPGNRLDDRRLADLRPEAVHGGLHRRRERIGGLVPHPFQELLGGDRPAVRGEQIFQDG